MKKIKKESIFSKLANISQLVEEKVKRSGFTIHELLEEIDKAFPCKDNKFKDVIAMRVLDVLERKWS